MSLGLNNVFFFPVYIAFTEGPFSILHTCLTKRLRVKVWTRRYKGLRGVLAGYLVAFDKHMNLVSVCLD